MKKVPTIFDRDWNGDKSRVTRIGMDVARWVFDGDGVATRKFDGTAVLIKAGELYCRYDAKGGKTPPVNFVPAQSEVDSETGHWPGWVPAGTDPQYKWQRAAFEFWKGSEFVNGDGTYEACGPHFQGNPEHYNQDVLVRHGAVVIVDCPRSFAELSEWFKGKDIEGIVWHHPDGRMAKIKKKDFGLRRSE
jgi:uncharacterized protein DUF5565